MSYRAIAILVLVMGALFGVKVWQTHLIAKGDAQGAARIQTRWNTAEDKRQGDEKEAAARLEKERAEAESKARIADQIKQQTAERIAREQNEREASLRASLDRAGARNRSLLDTINELNLHARARAAADVSSSSPDASAATLADEATTARSVLGQCSQRYTTVAADADGLRLQVIGLQAYVADVCLARKAGD